MKLDPWRTLARDGARRAEIRQIQREDPLDLSGYSWAEWWTLVLIGEAIGQTS